MIAFLRLLAWLTRVHLFGFLELFIKLPGWIVTEDASSVSVGVALGVFK